MKIQTATATPLPANVNTVVIDVATASGPELVAYYNANSGSSKPITRFRDHKTAVRKVTELQEALKEMATGSSKTAGKASKGDKPGLIKQIITHMEKAGDFANDTTGKDKAASLKELGKMGLPELKGELATWETPVEPVKPVKAVAGALPPPAPLPAPAPTPPSPQEIELVKDGNKGKRYVSKTEPGSKYHLRDRSEASKPVDLVRCFCRDNPTMARKEVIAELMKIGVNKNTAATQYSLFKKAQKDTAVQPGELMSEDESEE